ncbi:MAG: 50S ribosomal protein L13 [Candidatus Woesearchaeota archaeon]
MIIIDAENSIMGRVAMFAVEKAKEHDKVIVVNCEKAIISGNREYILSQYRHKMSMGTPAHGPFLRRSPEWIMKRAIRGMLEHKKAKGKELLKRIICYSGVPREFEGKPTEKAPKADISKLSTQKYMTVAELSKNIGGSR